MKREEALAALRLLHASGLTIAPKIREIHGSHLINGYDFSVVLLDPGWKGTVWVYDGPSWYTTDRLDKWEFRGFRLRRILTVDPSKNNAPLYEVSFNGRGEPSIRTNFKEKQK